MALKPGVKLTSPSLPKIRSDFRRGRKSFAFADDDFVFDEPGEEQLVLTEAELKEEITRILTSENPQSITNLIVFSYKDMAFKQVPETENLLIHLDIPSKLLHKTMVEASKPAVVQPIEPVKKPSSEMKEIEEEEEEEGEEKEGEEKEEKEEERTTSEAQMKAAIPEEAVGAKKLTNKFNFSERAAQTYNNPTRHREIQTEPPPRLTLSGNVTQWEIYDAYVAHAELQEKTKAKAAVKKTKKTYTPELQTNELAKMTSATKIIERMITQNIFDEISQDFKYWEDASDEYRDHEGTLLPLWKFTHEQAKMLAVTSLSWNTKYYDIFISSYGSYDYMKQQHGLICAFTLKNPSYPEYHYELDSGVLCVDTHPNHPYLIASGFYDGTVGVYNLKDPLKTASYKCDLKEGKHQDPVWQVKWQKDNLDGNLNFVSISSDGRVTNWVLMKADITFSNMIHLNLKEEPLEGPEGTHLHIKGCGTAIAFHKQKDSLFLVGTEEGLIHRCSTVYTNRFLTTYAAHSMAVHRIQWNEYHPDIFITCSADWTVKIWDFNEVKPLFMFDLGCPVGDVVWAPYSATVFAAATDSGKVAVFDLNVNKYKPICEQIVVQKRNTKLTSLAFNKHFTILIAGDNRGCITCLKLSPNLRRALKENRNMDATKYFDTEVNKLNKILAVVRTVKKQ